MAADPVPVACEVVMAIQTLVTRSLNIFAPGVVTVGKIQAGSAANIIPEVATLVGTVRTLSPATRSKIVEGLHRVAHGVADAHGLDAEVHVDPGYPVTVNDTEFARFVIDVGRELLGTENCPEQPSPQMAGEDFAYVLEQVPGAMASLGTRPAGFEEGEAPNAHSNRYLLNEDAMITGTAMYAAIALRYLR
jgi:hippurate hydrolase